MIFHIVLLLEPLKLWWQQNLPFKIMTQMLFVDLYVYICNHTWRLLSQVFEHPLREGDVLTTDELQAIFVNLKEIIVCNTKLVKWVCAPQHVHAYTHTYTPTHAHMHTHMHVHMHARAHTHTHAHTIHSVYCCSISKPPILFTPERTITSSHSSKVKDWNSLPDKIVTITEPQLAGTPNENR